MSSSGYTTFQHPAFYPDITLIRHRLYSHISISSFSADSASISCQDKQHYMAAWGRGQVGLFLSDPQFSRINWTPKFKLKLKIWCDIKPITEKALNSLPLLAFKILMWWISLPPSLGIWDFDVANIEYQCRVGKWWRQFLKYYGIHKAVWPWPGFKDQTVKKFNINLSRMLMCGTSHVDLELQGDSFKVGGQKVKITKSAQVPVQDSSFYTVQLN